MDKKEKDGGTKKEKKDAEDKLLLAAFNEKFGAALEDITVLNKLLGGPGVREWYADYRAGRAQVKALPEEWAAAGLTAAMWTAAREKAEKRRKIRAEHAAAQAKLAQEYEQKCRALNSKTNQALALLEDPLQKTIEAGYEQLPLGTRIKIESAAGEEERQELLKKELAAARAIWVANLAKGKDPFTGA